MKTEKRIEEVVNDLRECYTEVYLGDHDAWSPDLRKMAEALIARGYSKQSEGEWELHGNDDDPGCSFFCTACYHFSVDEDVFYRPATSDYEMYRYCPYCGAKMKGGESDA